MKHQIRTKKKTMRTQVQADKLIKDELQRRFDLVENLEFRTKCAEFMKQNNMCTAKEWNENKVEILLFLANEFCSIENEINKNK